MENNKKTEKKTIAFNRQARHNYELLKSYEAGLVLSGTEVKSLRAGKCQISDSWCEFIKGELWMNGVHISPYEQGNRYNKDPKRRRKLLMHRYEFRKLEAQIAEKGLALIPIKLYFSSSKVKVELSLARGKKDYDKRQSLKEKTIEREIRNTQMGG